jgi:putative transposase
VDYFSSNSSPAVAGDDVSVISKSAVAEKMSVSRQSLYYQPRLPAKDLLLKQRIETVLLEHRAYGHRRIALTLGVNKKRVKRVMKLFNLKTKKLRKKPKIKNRKSALKSRQNLLTNTMINKPDQAWVSDFTYLSYQNRFMYLATILDAFTREVIAWNISVRHNADLVCQALLNALNKRDHPPQIFHSDQGSEYCGITQST